MVNKNMITGAVALVAMAAIVLMGMAVVEGYSKEFRDTSSLTNTGTLTVPSVNVSTRLGTSEQFPYLQSMPNCTNDSGSEENAIFVDLNYTITEGSADGGLWTLNDDSTSGDTENTLVGESYNCTMTYLQDSTLQGHADKFSDGLAIIGTFIGVLVLAVLGMFIMNLFRRKKED